MLISQASGRLLRRRRRLRSNKLGAVQVHTDTILPRESHIRPVARAQLELDFVLDGVINKSCQALEA